MALKNRTNPTLWTFGLPTNHQPILKGDLNSKLLYHRNKDNAEYNKISIESPFSVETVHRTPVKCTFETMQPLESTEENENLYSPLLIGISPPPDRLLEEEFKSAYKKVKEYYGYINDSNIILEEKNHYYAFERAREAAMQSITLGTREFDFRRTVIDETMLRAANLKEHNLPITRATLQLAVSLLDRTLIELLSLQEMFQLEISKPFIIACSLLSTAIIFEKTNSSHHISCPIQRFFFEEIRKKSSQLDSQQRQKAILIFQKLQHYILDTVGYKVNTPLCVEFAHYFMIELGYDLSYVADDTQLVAYLLDCFVIHDSAVTTPASKAAAAAVTLMRRIFHPDKPMNQLWNSSIINVSGYCLKDLRPVLESMNEMLIKHADSINGLKALHRNGWADITWKMP